MLVYMVAPVTSEGEQSIVDESEKIRGRGIAVVHQPLGQLDKLIDRDEWRTQNLMGIQRCDALILTGYNWDGFEKEAIAYQEFAEENGIPIYNIASIDSVLLTVTEEKSPVQCSQFLNIIMNMYRVHLAKNADYSPANIHGVGNVGLAVRMWDKVVRILNLLGYEIHVEEEMTYHGEKEARNEPLVDAFEDVAVYGVIAQLMHRDAWGK